MKVVDPATRPKAGHSGGPGTADPGRIHSCCDAMISLLTKAYGVQSDRISGPAWISDFMGPTRYAVDALMPADTTKTQFQLMFQSLLMDRFHLKIHHETRSFPGYELGVAKGGPKFQEEPSGPGIAGEAPAMKSMEGPGIIRIQSRAESISALATELGSAITQALGADPADLEVPKARVIDKTGLTGRYSYTLEFACEGCRGREPLVSDLPNIFIAMERQLGLKLQKTQSVPLDVVVVDHLDKIPTGN